MISIVLLLLVSIARGDISEKLRQGQGSEGRPSNFHGLQPPLFGAVQKASGATNAARIVIPSHHHDEDDEDNLDRLCNDPFHSFLCNPLGPRKHRFDGRLRPGAVLPPGVLLSGSSSDLRETKSSLTTGEELLSDEFNGNSKRTNQVPSATANSGYSYPSPPPHQPFTQPPPSKQNSEEGYVYQKPINPLPFPSQQVTTKSPPPGPSYQYLPALETPKIDVRISSQTVQKPAVLPNSFTNTEKNTNNYPQRFPFRTSTKKPFYTQSTPTITTRPHLFSTTQSTVRPTVFTTPHPSVFSTTKRTTHRPNIFQSTQRIYNYPKPIQTTPKTTTYFFQAKSENFVQQNFQNNLDFPDATNTINSAFLTRPSNQYLPSINSDAKPTNQFSVTSIPKPLNEYLPAVEGQSTNLQQNVEGTALLADQIDTPKPLRKHERNHTLEELCNDAFHSFLCKPVTKQRKRIDGRIRPGAKIPPHVLLGAGSAEQNQRRLLLSQPNQQGHSLLPTELENNGPHPGYPYQVPNVFFDSTNVRHEYIFPGQFGNHLLTGAASDSLALAKHFSNRNSVSSKNVNPAAKTITNSQTENKGYFYTPSPKVDKQSNNTHYERPGTLKPQVAGTTDSNDRYNSNIRTQKPTQRRLDTVMSLQTEDKGYIYPKPNQTGSNGYFYSKPSQPKPAPAESNESTSIYSSTTSTLADEPIPVGTSQLEAEGYKYPKPATVFTLPTTKKPEGYVYTKPVKGREFTLPQFKPTSSPDTFGTRLSKTVNQPKELLDIRFRGSKSFQSQKVDNDDLPPASQFEILKP